MPLVDCRICKSRFYIKPNRLERGWGKYCSNKCKHLGFRNGSQIKCFTCKKSAYKSMKDQNRSKSKKYFCSKSCQTKWRNTFYKEEKHANWKGGEHSYKNIMWRSDSTPKCAKCKTVDTRVLAVHHKDKNRKNNVLSNLVWLCHNCHFLVHHYKSEAGKFLVLVA